MRSIRELIDKAGAFRVDGGPLLSGYEERRDPKGHLEEIVFRWREGGQEFEAALSLEEMAHGYFEGGVLHCLDTKGERTRLEMFTVSPLVPGEGWVVSVPDGFSISREPFSTMEDAILGAVEFVLRYRQQGYYKTVKGERISLAELAHSLEIKKS